MKKGATFAIAMLVGASLCVAAPAFAAREVTPPKPVKAVTPSKENAPLPEIEAPPPAPKPQGFPVLPPSRPCTATDLLGLFKLNAVYEDPIGSETSGFQSAPYQYLFFGKKNLFAKVNMETDTVSKREIVRVARQHSPDQQQFVIQDNFVYYYQDSIAIDVQACFVVANDKVPFKTGQVIMMPPKGQIKGRLAKVYDSLRPKKEKQPPPLPKGRSSQSTMPQIKKNKPQK
jgi:hypothetical protein